MFGGTSEEQQAVSLVTANSGFMLRPWRAETIFTDTGGTTPVANDGDAVARANTTSTPNARQGTAASRPLWKTSGGVSWLQPDGTDDSLIFQAATVFGAASTVVTCAAKIAAADVVARILGSSVTNDFGLSWQSNEIIQAGAGGFVNGTTMVTSTVLANVTTPHVLTWRRSQPLNSATIRDNGTQVGSTTHTNTGASWTLNLFARNGGANDFSRMKLYGLAVIPGVRLTDAEVALIEGVFAEKAGI